MRWRPSAWVATQPTCSPWRTGRCPITQPASRTGFCAIPVPCSLRTWAPQWTTYDATCPSKGDGLATRSTHRGPDLTVALVSLVACGQRRLSCSCRALSPRTTGTRAWLTVRSRRICARFCTIWRPMAGRISRRDARDMAATRGRPGTRPRRHHPGGLSRQTRRALGAAPRAAARRHRGAVLGTAQRG